MSLGEAGYSPISTWAPPPHHRCSHSDLTSHHCAVPLPHAEFGQQPRPLAGEQTPPDTLLLNPQGTRDNRRVTPYTRGALVPAVVDSHPSYGVMVRLPNGERALLEPGLFEPDPCDPDAWPAKGTRLDVVVLGYQARRPPMATLPRVSALPHHTRPGGLPAITKPQGA